MRLLDKLIESFLTEEVALTKGSQRVMNDKKLVAALADAVRDDAQSNPSAFPPGSKRNFQNAEDEAVAKWFLENIDRIEREGYEGVIYSRDGVNSDWIVRRYIAGSHSWEDLTGVMNMNLNDWYQLKNRNMLDVNHKDLPKFNSVRDVGYYMTTHYKNQLEKVRDAAKNAARNKMAKSLKLVDNDDYRIYTTLNRAAGCALGLGTQWCTANSNYSSHFHSYSSRAMLFQIFPYTGETDEDGKKVLADNEKYQFDAGGPNFMDITDRPVRPEIVREKFPYLFSDLSKALQTNKAKMEKGFEELANDPTLQGDDFKIKTYEIDSEIQKLHKFVDRGYMTDEVRPSKTSAEEPGAQPTVSTPASQLPQQGQQMESIKQLAQYMLEEVKLGNIVQQYKPLSSKADREESPLTHSANALGEEVPPDDNLNATYGLSEWQLNELEKAIKSRGFRSNTDDKAVQDVVNSMYSSHSINRDQIDSAKEFLYDYMDYAIQRDDDLYEIDDAGNDSMQDNVGNQLPTGSISSQGGTGMSSGATYSPGTAPTMPESIKTEEYDQVGFLKQIVADIHPYGGNKEEYLRIASTMVPAGYANSEEFKRDFSKAYDLFFGIGSLDDEDDDFDYTDYSMRQGEMGNPHRLAESRQKKETTMKNVDKDVAAMLQSLKKYDTLKESVAPVLAARPRLSEKAVDTDNEDTIEGDEIPVKEAGPAKHEIPAAQRKAKGGDWKTTTADLEKDASKSPTTKKGLEDLKSKTGIKEEADPDVLQWMSRFSKLGNTKGYGK